MNRDWVIFGFIWSFLFGMALFLLTKLYYAEQLIVQLQAPIQCHGTGAMGILQEI